MGAGPALLQRIEHAPDLLVGGADRSVIGGEVFADLLAWIAFLRNGPTNPSPAVFAPHGIHRGAEPQRKGMPRQRRAPGPKNRL